MITYILAVMANELASAAMEIVDDGREIREVSPPLKRVSSWKPLPSGGVRRMTLARGATGHMKVVLEFADGQKRWADLEDVALQLGNRICELESEKKGLS